MEFLLNLRMCLILVEVRQDIFDFLVFLSLFSGFALLVGTRLRLILVDLNLLDIEFFKLWLATPLCLANGIVNKRLQF